MDHISLEDLKETADCIDMMKIRRARRDEKKDPTTEFRKNSHRVQGKLEEKLERERKKWR